MSANSLINTLNTKWETLETREQNSLKILSVAVSIFVLYFAIWSPAQSFMETEQQLLEERKGLLSLVKSSQKQLARSNSTGSTARTMNSQQLVSTVTNMARGQKLQLKRFEPSGENKVKVWVEDVSFDVLVTWLGKLEKSVNVTVEQISVEKQDKPGVVSARLTLSS